MSHKSFNSIYVRPSDGKPTCKSVAQCMKDHLIFWIRHKSIEPDGLNKLSKFMGKKLSLFSSDRLKYKNVFGFSMCHTFLEQSNSSFAQRNFSSRLSMIFILHSKNLGKHVDISPLKPQQLPKPETRFKGKRDSIMQILIPRLPCGLKQSCSFFMGQKSLPSIAQSRQFHSIHWIWSSEKEVTFYNGLFGHVKHPANNRAIMQDSSRAQARFRQSSQKKGYLFWSDGLQRKHSKGFTYLMLISSGVMLP